MNIESNEAKIKKKNKMERSNLEITAILKDGTEKYLGTYSGIDFMPDSIEETISEIKKEEIELFGNEVLKIQIRDQKGNLLKSSVQLPELQ